MRHWPPLLTALALAGACGQADPTTSEDDLWPGFRRAGTSAYPTAEEIERACADASAHFKEEAEKTPGTYVDPTYLDYPVRNPLCRWEPASPFTAECQFEQTEVLPERRAETLRRLRDRHWAPQRARLVHVTRWAQSRWIAPTGCHPVQTGAEPEA